MPKANKRLPEKRVNKKIRPIKKRKPVFQRCEGGCKDFSVTKDERGAKRTCRICGWSAIEAPRMFTPAVPGFRKHGVTV
jgi:hypothetical protein